MAKSKQKWCFKFFFKYLLYFLTNNILIISQISSKKFNFKKVSLVCFFLSYVGAIGNH